MGSDLDTSVYRDRIVRARASMERAGVDVLLLSVGSDLPYLSGYEAMPLERLTMLVVPRDGEVTLVIPKLEAPRVTVRAGVFEVLPWNETDDPVAIVASLVARPRAVAVGDTMWARFLVELLGHWPSGGTRYLRGTAVMNELRMRKDASEVAALQAAGAAADRVATKLQQGDIALVGRTEAAVSGEISARLLAEGHDVVNFAIVATGENAASPHHHAGERVIARGDMVLCDFGGTMNGYCSDITRCVSIGEPPAEVAHAYAVLRAAQAAGVEAGVVGADCQDVDRAARRVITDGGYGEFFIHRTGHGIGMEAHEDPYMVEGNNSPIEVGHAFSVEPGIYVPGSWGMRLEDIVVATADGPLAINQVDHDLVVLG
ncbi:MAG: aminopeptidase P family protein [Actinobacteria bacterium]|nr:aminopeptidase P family protein [Actinomycetota bacterium]